MKPDDLALWAELKGPPWDADLAVIAWTVHEMPAELREAYLMASQDGARYAKVASACGVAEDVARQRVIEAANMVGNARRTLRYPREPGIDVGEPLEPLPVDADIETMVDYMTHALSDKASARHERRLRTSQRYLEKVGAIGSTWGGAEDLRDLLLRIDVDKPPRPRANAALNLAKRRLVGALRRLGQHTDTAAREKELEAGDCMKLLRFAFDGDERMPMKTLSPLAHMVAAASYESAQRWFMALDLMCRTKQVTQEQAEPLMQRFRRGLNQKASRDPVAVEVRERELATHRGRRRREERGEDLSAKDGLPVPGWYRDPTAPLVAWNMDETFNDTVLKMPALRRATLIRVRQDGLSYGAVAAERGLSVEGVAGNIAEALADLRAALREGRRRDTGSDEAPDPDLVLLGRWLAGELTPDEEKAFESQFIADDAFHAKVAPAMQIWTLPTGMVGADDFEDEGLGRIDRDLSLITDYLARGLSEEDTAAVDALLETDVAFYVKVQSLIDFWRSPVRMPERPERVEGETGEEEREAEERNARSRAAEPEKKEDLEEEDLDLTVITWWLRGWLPLHHGRAVDDRLANDDAFYEKVSPVMKIWMARSELMKRTTVIGDEPVDAADPDVALIQDCLGFRLSRVESGRVEERLKGDETFARKVAPMVKAWRVPGRVG